jgi:hypothetical protein
MLRILVKTTTVDVDDRTLSVRFFEVRTPRGTRRYSAEILFGPEDCVILDDDSVSNLEAKAMRLIPATLESRSGRTPA